jgi:hypothetical protein
MAKERPSEFVFEKILIKQPICTACQRPTIKSVDLPPRSGNQAVSRFFDFPGKVVKFEEVSLAPNKKGKSNTVMRVLVG